MKTYMLAPTFSDALNNRYSGGPFFRFDQDWLLSTDEICVCQSDDSDGDLDIEASLPDDISNTQVSAEYIQLWTDGLEYMESVGDCEINGVHRDALVWAVEKMVDRLTTLHASWQSTLPSPS